MSDLASHSHLFLGTGHEEAERRTRAVVILCSVMMVVEIAGGLRFGSIALVADGLHMSTHAGALLLAALAYRYARTRAGDPRFSFGTGKFGDLAGYTSAIVLAMIALLIAVEALRRLFAPVPIRFTEAIPIAALGLIVNLLSAWLLAGGGADGHHHHHHHHGPAADAPPGRLEIFETGTPPVFRLGGSDEAAAVSVVTERPDGSRQTFRFRRIEGGLESIETIPEPHEFLARLRIGGVETEHRFTESDHATHRDNNLRAAVVHVVADAAVSVMVILGLALAWGFGWVWMDPVAGLVGAAVIASWAVGLVRDTGGILLDMQTDPRTEAAIRAAVAAEGDVVTDLHLWRLGPGHLGAIVAVESAARDAAFYHARLAGIGAVSHLTVEARQPPPAR